MKAKRFAVLLVLLMLMTALTLSLIVFAAPTNYVDDSADFVFERFCCAC